MRIKRSHLLLFGAAFGIVVLYLFLRLFNILSLPLFTDEAIYVRWAQIAKQDASWRFISLTDGKQPMFVWIAAAFMKFIKDPLLAGRLVSVFAGIMTAVGLFFLGNEVFREKSEKIFSFTSRSVTIGLLSSFIYVIYPFGLVYDRMALYDSLVGTFAVWALYLLIVMVRTLRLDVALIAGIVSGGGGLTKSNDFFSVYSIPFLLLIFDRKKKMSSPRLAKFISLSLLVAVIAYAMYSMLRLSPYFHIIGDKNALFVYPIREWIEHPFTYFNNNMSALLNWLFIYFSAPGIVLVIASFVINKKNFLEKTVLVLWFAFPFIALGLFGKLIYPRFILFMTLPLIPLVAYSIYELFVKYKNAFVRFTLIIFTLAFYVYADYFVLTNFALAPIPKADLGQYINGWSAGNGVKQSVVFFGEQAKSSKIYIMTEGTFGLMPFGLEIYLVDNPSIKIQAVWPIKDAEPAEVITAAKKMPTYAIFYQPCPSCGLNGGNIPPSWHAERIASYRQGESNSYYSIYRILP